MKIVDRRASDNKYLHRDFHISMNMLMEYIRDQYGSAALTEYLVQFSKEFNSLRIEQLKEGSLEGLREYFIDVYDKEEWPVSIELENDVLTITQKACPGIAHLISKGYEPVEQYIETYTTVYETLCGGTPYEYIMENYDPKTGACCQRFQRRVK